MEEHSGGVYAAIALPTDVNIETQQETGWNFQPPSYGFEDAEHVVDEDIMKWILEMQSMWDQYKAPKGMQDKMLRRLFSGVGTSKGKKCVGASKKKSLLSLFAEKPNLSIEESKRNLLPCNMDQLLRHYESMGMIRPQRWRLCIGKNGHQHPPKVYEPSQEDFYVGEVMHCVCSSSSSKPRLKRDCAHCCEKCSVCQNSRKCMVSFDYLSFLSQLQVLCQSSTYCHEMLAMWRARNAWIGKAEEEQVDAIDEFWDGQKVRQYQEFWDPTKYWELPFTCPNEYCRMVYRTFPRNVRFDKLNTSCNEDGVYEFSCVKCRKLVRHKKTMVKGDPRNFALMFHWDGFQAASTTQKDSGVVEMVILNGGKKGNIGPLPTIFLPFSTIELEKKHGDILSHFLVPVLRDLETLFLEGLKITFNYPCSKISEGLEGSGNLCTLRGILMMWTGDHPAQSKLGLFKDGGKNGCRRDRPHTKKVSGGGQIPYYVFNDNRLHGRYPPAKRTVDEMLDALCQSRRVRTKKQKEEILGDAGLAGESCLWRLYHLYGFDLSRDLVYDVMHILALNLFKKYIKALIERSNNETKKTIDSALKEVKGFVPAMLASNGRWPKNISKHYNTYKAEDYQKFVQWCLPYILIKVEGIPQVLKRTGMLMVDIAHIFYGYSRLKGWSSSGIEVARKLLLSWRIMTEEFDGANSSPLEHIAGNGEMLDDVVRHGSHDVLWCYDCERKVSSYLAISTNNRTNEMTYMQYHARLLFTRVQQQLYLEKDGLLPNERALLAVHNVLKVPEGIQFSKITETACEDWHVNCILAAPSEKAAIKLLSDVAILPCMPCSRIVQEKGMLVGSLKKKQQMLSLWEHGQLSSFWKTSVLIGYKVCYSKVFLDGTKYIIGDHVILQSCVAPLQSKLQVGKICGIFSHDHSGELQVFVVVEYCNSGNDLSLLQVNEETGMPVLSSEALLQKAMGIRIVRDISRKCFFMPVGTRGEHVMYEMCDMSFRNRLLEVGRPGCVPPWLEEGDIVLTNIREDILDSKLAIVRSVNKIEKRVQLGFLCKEPNTSELIVDMEEAGWWNWEVCAKIEEGWKAVEEISISVDNQERRRAIRWKQISS